MNISESIINHPVRLYRCSGLTTEQFHLLAKRLTPLWQQAECERLTRLNRKRVIGAGHPYRLKTIEEKLVCLLLWYKLYPAFWFLGLLVDLDASNTYRLVIKLRPLLEQVADPQLKTYLKTMQQRRRKINSWEELTKEFPEVAEVLIDATEQERLRPAKRIQKRYYSGKKKRHTFKTQLISSLNGRVLEVSRMYPGHWHDYSIFKRGNPLRLIPEEADKWLDLGYDGVKTDYPKHRPTIHQAIKRRRNKPILTKQEKRHNRLVAKVRIKAEHIISWLKKYQVLDQKYRQASRFYNQDFRNIAALINFRHGFTS